MVVGYDDKIKKEGWECRDPTSRRCYTSKNVVFDEASLWWSSQSVVLPNLKVIKEVQERMEEVNVSSKAWLVEEVIIECKPE